MISKKTKYGLKALIYLARQYEQGPILIADLARDENIPKKFLESILLALKNSGILQSRKGKGGGYYLGRSPRQITMGQAIRVMEGPLAPVQCVSETAYAKCTECGNENTCGIRLVMKDVRDAIAKIVDHTTLADVLERIAQAELTEKNVVDFCI
ncbi:RrF2 family transcriptional regulator [Geomonas azotofigens]|uniref:RrF2 family transcriptional regulator n=1 Tax=Geomonas azotofigens TaxID=2843196 RepID=UPI001C0F5E2F|nr:Rrf2 family transcriptional regulator [Geomonas azotofigens]MBU5614700.1 Rrf2 family transcriptional regulator [Geomonas azotofigens]